MNHLLIGLPGSGKSTFAQQLAKLDSHSVIISTDRIRGELFGDEATQGSWAEIEAEVFRRVKQAIARGKSVIYDATNINRAWRLDWLEKAAAVGARQWMAWYLNLPLATCLQRNQNRDRQVPEEWIVKVAANLEAFPPHIAEGFVAVQELQDLSLIHI